MSAGRLDLTVEGGADWSQGLTWRLPAPDGAQGAPRDLTGASAVAAVAAHPGAPPALVLTSAPGGGVVLGGPAGTLLLTATAAQTRALAAALRAGVWDLLVRLADGRVVRLVAGAVTVAAPVAGEPA